MGSVAQDDVTDLLHAWGHGDESALSKLIPVVYGELRRRARRYMAHERPGHTLQTTALIHEAYLRLVGSKKADWENRARFYALSARLMRQILVDHARTRACQKRGGDCPRVSFDEALIVPRLPGPDLVRLDEALNALAVNDERKSRVVELRYFGGLSVEETATALEVSPQTVLRDWRLAKTWLLREISREAGGEVRALEES
jgi:RNA polymerase sigma factor (TIGR02999 family)